MKKACLLCREPVLGPWRVHLVCDLEEEWDALQVPPPSVDREMFPAFVDGEPRLILRALPWPPSPEDVARARAVASYKCRCGRDKRPGKHEICSICWWNRSAREKRRAA